MKTRFRKLRGPTKQGPVVTTTKEMISAEQLVQQFPIGSYIYVTITCDLPDPLYPERGLLKDQDVVRITPQGWELLASNRGDWVSKYLTDGVMTREQFVEQTYKETTYIYEKESHGCITARVFYLEDKKLLRGWKFISPEFKVILKAASIQTI